MYLSLYLYFKIKVQDYTQMHYNALCDVIITSDILIGSIVTS